MCIPKIDPPAAQPTQVPSMQAADNLQLAGPARGAAQLGRLQLRLAGQPPAPVTPKPAVAASVQASPDGGQGIVIPGFAKSGSGGGASSGVASSMANIRFGGLGGSPASGFGGMGILPR